MKGLKRVFAITIALVIVLSTFIITTDAADPITSYGIVKADLLNIRASANTNSTIVGRVARGELVGIHWSIPGWSCITYKGITGYVSVDYITFTQASRSGKAISVSKQAVVKLTSDALNLRASASTDAKVLASIPNGATVTVSEITSDWAKITYNGKTGYVAIRYLDFNQKPQAQSKAQTSTPQPAAAPSRGTSVSSKGQAVVELAKQHLGKAYVYGATGPNNFDCSGLVYYVYKQLGVSLNRVANDQMRNGTYVSKDQLQPGDIVGFSRGNGYVHHVGIYAGNGMMIHAPQTGDVVKYESIVTGSYSKRLIGGRRIF